MVGVVERWALIKVDWQCRHKPTNSCHCAITQLPIETTFSCHTPKCIRYELSQQVLHFHSHCCGRRGVAPQRHLSVGAYNRKRTLASLLCAKRVSNVRGGTIPRCPLSTRHLFGDLFRLSYAFRLRSTNPTTSLPKERKKRIR